MPHTVHDSPDSPDARSSSRPNSRRSPAQQFADELARMGASVRWRDERAFEASHGHADTRRVADIWYDPQTGRFKGARTEKGKALLTKRGVRVHLGIYPYGRPRFDAAPIPSLGLTPK